MHCFVTVVIYLLLVPGQGIYLSLVQVIHCSGYLKVKSVAAVDSSYDPAVSPSLPSVGMVAVAHSLPPSSITEIKMQSNVFMFRARYIVQCTSSVTISTISTNDVRAAASTSS